MSSAPGSVGPPNNPPVVQPAPINKRQAFTAKCMQIMDKYAHYVGIVAAIIVIAGGFFGFFGVPLLASAGKIPIHNIGIVAAATGIGFVVMILGLGMLGIVSPKSSPPSP